MSALTEAPAALDTETLTDTTAGGTAPTSAAGEPAGAVVKCPGVCACSTAEGHVFGGLPYVLTVTMGVAGLPPMDVAEIHGSIGQVIAGPALTNGADTDGPYLEVETIRSLEVVGPTFGEIYRETARRLAEAVPGLHDLAAQQDAQDAADEAEPAPAAANTVPACTGGGQDAQGARCQGEASEGFVKGLTDTPETSSAL